MNSLGQTWGTGKDLRRRGCGTRIRGDIRCTSARAMLIPPWLVQGEGQRYGPRQVLKRLLRSGPWEESQ